jgi:hypothetical protein
MRVLILTETADLLGKHLTEREKQLTATFCPSETTDFLAIAGKHIYLHQEDFEEWTEEQLGQPVFYVEPKMIWFLDDAQPEQFLEVVEALKKELPGVEIKVGDSSVNQSNPFYLRYFGVFDNALDKAIGNAFGDFGDED